MKEGEPVLGGPQVSPGNVQPTNPGVQPVGFETLQNTQNIQAAPPASSPSPTFIPNVPLGGARLNNPAPQPAPVFPPAPAQSLQQFSPQSTTPPAAPNMGDIILSDTPPQKSKKGLVIALVLFVIILAGGLGVYFFISQNAKNTANTTTQTLASNYREAFNEYANYILYGKDSTDNIIVPSDNDIYYAIWLAADEKNVGFFDKAKNLLDNFLNWQEKSSNELLEALIIRYSDIFDFYYLYNIKPRIPISYIAESYINEGKDTTAKYIEENYEAFKNSSELAQTYGSKQKEIDLSILEQTEIAHKNGCVENNVPNQECLNALGISFLEQRQATIEDIQGIIYDASHDVVFDCFTIANEIYSAEKEQNDTE